MDNVIYPRFGLRPSARTCGTATAPSDFRGEIRAAQIAAELCHKNGYGLTVTQQFQRECARRVRRDGLTPYMAAHLVVRGPREPFFGDAA